MSPGLAADTALDGVLVVLAVRVTHGGHMQPVASSRLHSGNTTRKTLFKNLFPVGLDCHTLLIVVVEHGVFRVAQRGEFRVVRLGRSTLLLSQHPVFIGAKTVF